MSIATSNRSRPAFLPLVVAAVIALATAIVAFGVIGFASAQAPPAAPTNVTVLASGEGFVVGWDASDAATSHWVAWMSVKDYDDERAAGDWTKALKYEHVASGGDTYVIPYDSSGEDYWIIVGSVSGASAVTWGSWHREKALVGTIGLTDDEITREYVKAAIAYYDANGREATIARYRSPASVANGRSLTLLDADESRLLVYRTIPTLQGQYVGPGSRFTGFQRLIDSATAAGAWVTDRGINPVTKQEEPRRNFVVLHDGLVFYAGHSVLVEDVAKSTQEYVNRAIAKYDAEGLEATIDYYNSQDSLEGQFYLFFIGADDNYLAHPIFPHLIGTDIKDVVGSDGQRLGEEIAQATEAGIWVEYLWPHPVTRREMQKVTWAVRHDGLIFASGYYAGGSDTGTPPWQNVADPEQYTEDYVNRAIEKYERDGLESMLNYYNSVASFEGEWYLFATDANDIYHVHPLVHRLIGTDIKDVVGSDGYELGKELAKAVDGGKGVWVDYLWPHPVTLQEVPKRGYAVRHDGMLFASGYYPQSEDPAGDTQAYVQRAIDYYVANGLEETIAYYSSDESLDGQWNLTLADEKNILRVAPFARTLVGRNLNDLPGVSKQLVAATEDGLWVSAIFPNTRSSETLYAHAWAIRYDGLLFSSRYYDDQPDVPDAAKSDDQLTRAYVMDAIAYYDENGLDTTVSHYNSVESVEGERSMTILQAGDQTVLASATDPYLVGGNTFTGPGTPLGNVLGLATPEGYWGEIIGRDYSTGQEAPRAILAVRHDGLIFASSHLIVRKDIAGATQDYVEKAIALYDSEGQAATVAYYDSRDSLDGQFYLFLIGADDIYIAHPIFPHLKGTDIKDVKDSTGYELGQEIAKATAAGHWVEYLWPNPVTGLEEPKHAWVIRHDGLIFASGYYEPDPDAEPPAWEDADPEPYTVEYVNRAIARYDRDGLEAMLNYYNSVASFEGQWYLFGTDENDIYHVHPLFSNLIGKDIKDLPQKDSEGNDLGQTIAGATSEGIWVKYLWPHPLTLQDAPKVAYVVRHKGLIFASGYYPSQVEDPRAYTQDYAARAIAMYEREGLTATTTYYNSLDSYEHGQWFLMMTDGDLKILAHPLAPQLVGANYALLAASIPGFPAASELASVTEEGKWFEVSYFNPLTSEADQMILWVIRHDGLLFAAAYTGSE